MKKTIRLLISSLVILSTLLIASGCASPTPAPTQSAPQTAPQSPTQSAPQSSENQKLTLWVNGRDSYIGPNEQQLPQEQWYISQAIKRFESKNPGVSIELVVQSDALQAHQTFKTAGLAGNAPDMANLWSGQFTFADKDVIASINDKIPQADKDNLVGWNTVTLDFKEGNPILGYPTPDNQLCFFLYNKKITKEAGLDFEANPPRTMADFYSAMDKIKAKGYIPIAVDEANDGYPYYFFQIAAYWWVQEHGFDPILAADAGKGNFADDKALLAALNAYHDIWAKGYMNQDAATSSDSWQKFLQGKVAMSPRVTSFVKDAQDALGVDNVGVIKPPDITDTAQIKNSTIGGPGQDIVISKNSKYADTAVKFLSFLNSKEEVIELNKFQTKVPIRKDITAQDLNLKPDSVQAKLLGWSKDYVFWVDNSLSSAVVDDFTKLLPLVLTGKMTPEDLMKQLDKDKVAK